MGTWKHRITAVTETSMTCSTCGEQPLHIHNGRPRCYTARKQYRRGISKYGNYLDGRKSYRKHLKDKCERCGFIPEHKCQLDIHHVDNNHKNNAEENLVTLCANCHRYVHYAPA